MDMDMADEFRPLLENSIELLKTLLQVDDVRDSHAISVRELDYSPLEDGQSLPSQLALRHPTPREAYVVFLKSGREDAYVRFRASKDGWNIYQVGQDCLASCVNRLIAAEWSEGPTKGSWKNVDVVSIPREDLQVPRRYIDEDVISTSEDVFLTSNRQAFPREMTFPEMLQSVADISRERQSESTFEFATRARDLFGKLDMSDHSLLGPPS